VTERVSGRPLAGALVMASWAFTVGRGLSGPAGAKTVTVETDSDGRYVVPRLTAPPPAPARVERVTLIAYRRGYVAYRSDRVFESLADGSYAPRRDFSQRGNEARLERISGEVSRVAHLRFAGAGGEIKRELESELQLASLEASRGAPSRAVAPGALLDASGLLSADELKAVSGHDVTYRAGRLGDLPRTPTYDSLHFRAEDRPETWDAAVRMWRLPTGDAAEGRFQAVAAEVPRAQLGSELADRTLRGSDQGILAGALLDKKAGLVLELTCGVDACGDGDRTMALLGRLYPRALAPARTAEGTQP
jgi:hypothetical protein